MGCTNQKMGMNWPGQENLDQIQRSHLKGIPTMLDGGMAFQTSVSQGYGTAFHSADVSIPQSAIYFMQQICIPILIQTCPTIFCSMFAWKPFIQTLPEDFWSNHSISIGFFLSYMLGQQMQFLWNHKKLQKIKSSSQHFQPWYKSYNPKGLN